jgi:small subunit ribosomal protein S3
VGQKVHPRGFRLGIYQDWNSRWIAHKEYSALLHEDIRLRKYFAKTLDFAGVSHIEIERPALKNVRINIHTARPGLVIGKKGLGIETIKKTVQKMVAKEIFVNIKEVRRPDLDAQLVAENVATQLKRRVAFRRAMKKAVTAAMRLGAEGIRIQCSGRLAGAEMARREWYREGRVPLHTLKADIDYGFAESLTTYGLIGVKVWMCKGDLTERKREI